MQIIKFYQKNRRVSEHVRSEASVCVYIYIYMVQLMYVFKTHINHLFLEIFYRELKKLLKKLVTFS